MRAHLCQWCLRRRRRTLLGQGCVRDPTHQGPLRRLPRHRQRERPRVCLRFLRTSNHLRSGWRSAEAWAPRRSKITLVRRSGRARIDQLSRSVPGQSAGSFMVWDGSRAMFYDAASNTYLHQRVVPTFSAFSLIGDVSWRALLRQPGRCDDPQAAGRDRILSWDVVHGRCGRMVGRARDWPHPPDGGRSRRLDAARVELRPTWTPQYFHATPPAGSKPRESSTVAPTRVRPPPRTSRVHKPRAPGPNGGSRTISSRVDQRFGMSTTVISSAAAGVGWLRRFMLTSKK